jgi:hypothetical protein
MTREKAVQDKGEGSAGQCRRQGKGEGKAGD